MKCLSEVVAVDPSILARVSHPRVGRSANVVADSVTEYSCIPRHFCHFTAGQLAAVVLKFLWRLMLCCLFSVGHAAWGPLSPHGQFHQCARGSCGAAGPLRAKSPSAHWAVLWHAHWKDSGNFLTQWHTLVFPLVTDLSLLGAFGKEYSVSGVTLPLTCGPKVHVKCISSAEVTVNHLFSTVPP